MFSSCITDVTTTKHNKQSIVWRDLSYKVTQLTGWKFKEKVILNQLNGHFNVGTLNCLLAPSGAGKSTLLECLSSSNKAMIPNKGSLAVDYNLQTESQIVSYFISQHVEENIAGEFTVAQILQYAFAFKNTTTNQATKKQHITAIMTALMLPPDLLDRPFARCSGGEKKRIAIAQELMALEMPAFLLVDEPTTGLDSMAAFEVMSCLRNIAKRHNITVIASIHAPNDETLQLFDQLYVLAKRGICIYSGLPTEIGSFLEKECQIVIRKQYPPIEALIQIACDVSEHSLATKLAAKQAAAELSTPIYNFKVTTKSTVQQTEKSFQFSDLATQLHRLFQLTFIANFKTFLALNFLLFASFQFTILFFDKQMATSDGCMRLDGQGNGSAQSCEANLDNDVLLRENGTFIRYTYQFTGFFTMLIGTITFLPLTKVLQSEHRNHWYNLATFYASTVFVSLVEMTIYALVMAFTNYFFTNQQLADNGSINFHRLGLYLFTIWLFSLYHQSIGQLVGTVLMSHPQLALLMSIFFNLEMIIFNMAFFNIEKTGLTVLIWLSDVIAVKYLTKMLFYVFYGLDRCIAGEEIGYFIAVFNVDQERIANYILRVAINLVAVKLFTFVCLYIQLNTTLLQRILYYFINCCWIDKSSSNTSTANGNVNLAIEFEFDENIANIKQNGDEKQISTCIAWRNLCLLKSASIVEAGSQSGCNTEDAILRQLNGQLQFGTLTSLMGNSGAGKTSLLRVLNGQCQTRLCKEAQIYLSKFTLISTCFIAQDVSVHLMPGLTALQMLTYASKLNNAQNKVHHEDIALKWLQELDLLDTANTPVERCSGGERKRLAVAIELTSLQMPNLICVDEPSSGLDTNSAEIVISTLRKLAQSHCITIVTSIHQPTTIVLNMFDQLYVLARGGVCIFSGPPDQIQAHLNSISISTTSPFAIEELIKHSCSHYSDPIVQKLARQARLNLLTAAAQLADAELSTGSVPQNRNRFTFYSVKILLLRYFNYIAGSQWKQLFIFYLVNIAFDLSAQKLFDPKMALQSGCIDIEDDFNSTCIKSPETLEQLENLLDHYAYSFFIVLFFLFVITLQASLSLATDLPYFVNEQHNGWYSTGAFYLTRNIVDLLQLLPIVLVHLYICTHPFPTPPGTYWHFVLVLFLAATAIQAVGHICAVLAAGNTKLQIMYIISLLIVFILLSNCYIQIAKLNYAFQFIANLSIIRFAFESFVLLQYGFGRCGPRDIQVLLYAMKLDDADYYHNFLLLGVNVVLLRIVAMCLLMRKVNRVDNRQTRLRSNSWH